MLPSDDVPGEDDAFEVEDCEVVIFKFIRGMVGYDVIFGSNEVAKFSDSSHWPSLAPFLALPNVIRQHPD